MPDGRQETFVGMTETAHRVPDGRRIYAIGDIHGRLDLLQRMHALIGNDLVTLGPREATVVYLGDYVDRGPSSYEVIDCLCRHPLSGVHTICLMGNHEDMMLAFLDGEDDGLWFMNGGDATIRSYGIDDDCFYLDVHEYQNLRRRLSLALPAPHAALLRALKYFHIEGDYLFVHAGVRPGTPLDRQQPRDLMWIRGPFLASSLDHGWCVVHGHTIGRTPELRSNRIAIDTGAVFSGHLTCLVLEGCSRRFLST
jgi:serine/threonine protein phosphatase 1